MTDAARIVVVGGGAIGCGVAFQLAEAGVTDVLVLEKEPALCAVTSAQAAGLVGQVRSSVERTRLAMWSVATFS
ncbi:MAG TPA: FAD-binding oxidoreductase, partial [Rhodospirillales bacterium]|nr:FAD-binding oxidoreductase [Rhodospirillales bacterium]